MGGTLMARIRTIKPEFFTSEDVVALSPLARLLFIACWCEADKEGRMPWKPKTLKMRYLPADDCDIESLCAELVSGGLVRLYGEGLAFIPAFTMHQHVNPRESASQLPAPDEKLTRQRRVVTRDTRVNSEIDPQVGREGKGKEGKTRDASSTEDGFADFWLAYPNRKARQDAERAWAKLSPDADTQALILSAVARQHQGEDWLKDGGRFIPHASTWLNGKRWLDELAPSATEQLWLEGAV